MCRLKARAGKLWSRAQVLVNKKVSVLNLFFKYQCIVINCFTLVFNDFDCKPYFKANNGFDLNHM